MAITTNATYLPTMDKFIAHWTAVNASLQGSGSPPPAGWPTIVLEGTRSIAVLGTQRTALAAARLDVEQKLNTAEFARADYAIKAGVVLARAGQFADSVRAFWSTTPFPALLPKLPGVTAAPGKVESALDDVADVWTRINAAVPPAGVTVPLVFRQEITPAVPVPADYTLANLTADITALKAAAQAMETAKVPLANSRAARNGQQDLIRPVLVDYREAVAARLPSNSPLLETLPRYSPVPGSTPEAATMLAASWDAALGLAVITFVPSVSAGVVRHELRFVPGPDYSAEDEEIAASLAVGSTARFETLAGLPIPAVTASYKIYAITADDNERGSAAVSVARP